MKTKIRKSRPGGTILLPGTLVSIVSFPRVGHGVGQAADPHFDPHRKVKICNKKHLKSSDFRCFLELLGGFEPPTSSLPIRPGLCCLTLLRLFIPYILYNPSFKQLFLLFNFSRRCFHFLFVGRLLEGFTRLILVITVIFFCLIKPLMYR